MQDLFTCKVKNTIIENNEDLVTCPHCGFIGKDCDMPDLFYTDSSNTKAMNEQAKLQEELISLGYNIVTCGDCGQVFIVKLNRK